MTKIFIIGNGPSATTNEIGTIIDKADIVIRINDFKTKPYEKFVGTKTDILFTCRLNEYLTTLHTFPAVVLCLLMNPLDGVHIPVKLINAPNIIANITWENISPLIKLFDFKNDCYPSTGLLSILYAIKRFGPVHITGFDFFYGGNTHYYQDGVRAHPHRHDGKREKEIVGALAALGLVILPETYPQYRQYDGHDCFLGA